MWCRWRSGISCSEVFAVLRLSLILLFASTAAVACPGPDALERGIRFEIAGGESESFRRQGPHILSATYAVEGDPVSRMLLAQGLYMLELIDIEDGAFVPPSRATYTYEVEPGRMPQPMAGATWSATVTVFEGGSVVTERQVFGFGGESQVSFGPCTYRMIPVEIRYPDAEDGTVELVHYLPELGLSYLARSTWDRGEERYDYLGIEALE
jgi:hypothetical protein